MWKIKKIIKILKFWNFFQLELLLVLWMDFLELEEVFWLCQCWVWFVGWNQRLHMRQLLLLFCWCVCQVRLFILLKNRLIFGLFCGVWLAVLQVGYLELFCLKKWRTMWLIWCFQWFLLLLAFWWLFFRKTQKKLKTSEKTY